MPMARGNSFGAPQEHPGPVTGSWSELCSPLVSRERQRIKAGWEVGEKGDNLARRLTRFRFTEEGHWHQYNTNA